MTTLLGKVDEVGKLPRLSAEQLQELRQQVEQQGGAVKEAKAAAAADKVPLGRLGGVVVTIGAGYSWLSIFYSVVTRVDGCHMEVYLQALAL